MSRTKTDSSDNARKANTPWRGDSIIKRRKTVKKMTECEALTGHTAEELHAIQVGLRAAALARFSA